MPWFYVKGMRRLHELVGTFFYTSRERRLFKEITKHCDLVERRMRVQLTPHTRALVMNTLEAVYADPSASWHATPKERDEVVDELLQRLPHLLAEFVTPQRGSRRPVTYFETLHWLGRRLDSICPFQKRRG